MKIKITSDSTCDLSKEYVEAHNVGIMPLVVVKDGESFKDGVDIGYKQGDQLEGEGSYEIIATDKAGNSTIVVVVMKPISELSAPLDALHKENVNSDNKQAIEEVKTALEMYQEALKWYDNFYLEIPTWYKGVIKW